MDSARYYVALVLVIAFPPMLLAWPLIHPFVRFWRKLGPGWTYTVVGTFIGAGMVGLSLIRRPLLAIEFGTSYPLAALGALCFAASLWMGLALLRHMTITLILGLPEIAPERHPAGLVTQGIYARIRHPRYVQLALGLLGCALFANYLAPYATFALWLPGLWTIVVLEERELRDRFGAEYEAYCRRVPRFVPRSSRGPRRAPGR
ncbi:MAG TPA: methyltransferase [Candidatus Sulfotelmatobacter sp.]|nr:methyltransferase [Candidatus Sulfotelmatobacter sp.]